MLKKFHKTIDIVIEGLYAYTYIHTYIHTYVYYAKGGKLTI